MIVIEKEKTAGISSCCPRKDCNAKDGIRGLLLFFEHVYALLCVENGEETAVTAYRAVPARMHAGALVTEFIILKIRGGDK